MTPGRRSSPSRTASPHAFASLAAVERAVIACEQCPRLRRHCAAVARDKRRAYQGEEYWGRPVPAFGDPRARLVIVGLAPGAHGSNRTGRMFTGDSSGAWLYRALHATGFAAIPTSESRADGQRLTDCWITAAGRCAPPDNRPTAAELDRCRPYLAAELRLLPRTRVVLALGRVAHEAWLRASGGWERLPARERPQRPKFAHGAEHRSADGIVLLSSFHPSRQNTQTRRLTWQMWQRIFVRARELVDGSR
jgi:uracil-DNA glycosylase family 4